MQSILLAKLPATVIDQLKMNIDQMTKATDEQKEIGELLKALRERFNTPDGVAIRAEWEKQLIVMQSKGKWIMFLTSQLLRLTGDEINLWPRHLKFRHPASMHHSMYDTPKARQAADGEEVCCVCMDNLPNAKFTGCCGFSGVCTVCASSLIRRLLECPQCGDMLFDFALHDA